MEDWKKYYDEAGGYAKAAFGAFRKNRLGNEVVFNLIGLSIENYLTAVCMKFNTLPEHSTIGSMLHLLKKYVEIPEAFAAESRFMNRFMDYFCSLEVMEIPKPSSSDLNRMLGFTEDVRNFSSGILGVQYKRVEM
ncbi:MAG: hypothetical protein ACK5M7_13380 [Draconibacterium sp.]